MLAATVWQIRVTHMRERLPVILLAVGLSAGLPTLVSAAQWHVASGGTGSGSATAPFGRIQDAILAAQPGDDILVGPGTFNESLMTTRGGSPGSPITVRAVQGRGSTLVTAQGRVVTVLHSNFVLDGLVLDGQYGANDLVRLGGGGHGFVMRNTEVRRSGNDAIDMGAVQDVLIENSLIHHALNAANGRTDAHGIVGGAVQRLTVRNTEIHTFSGDAIQVDAGRSAPGWNDVVIEGCRFWLQPLPTGENGFPAGTVPGENAIDTKASPNLPRARITIRNSEAWGFRWPTTGDNVAAFNLKENVDAVVNGVTARDSEIAFRVRGPASVRVQNAVIYNVDVAVRYEDNIQNLRIWNSTIGNGVAQAFRAASASQAGVDVRNLLVLGSALPREAAHASNLAVDGSTFVDAGAHNYQLAGSTPAIDRGVPLLDVDTDRVGTTRPQGLAYDIGAYERILGEGRSPAPPQNLRIIRSSVKSARAVGGGHDHLAIDEVLADDVRNEGVASGVPVGILCEHEWISGRRPEIRKQIDDRIVATQTREVAEVLELIGLRQRILASLPVVRALRGVPMMVSGSDRQDKTRA